MPKFSTFRAAAVLMSLAMVLVALVGRVAYLQTYGRQQNIRRADAQQHQNETLVARRGSIYDAKGNLLAGTVQTQSLYVDPEFLLEQYQVPPRSLAQMDEAMAQLAKLIDRDPFELSREISEKADKRFVRLADNLDEATCQAIVALNMPGVGIAPMNDRYYPMGSIAAHVLGGVSSDGTGLEGLELVYEKLLAGRSGFKRTLKDARRRGISVSGEDYLPPMHGQHLILTIDANIQMIAEQELAEACQKVKASRGEVIVMDPRSGEIVAMANWPTFNPQNLADSTPEVRRNNCLVSPFEPGSAIKPFIAGPALSWSVTRPEEMWPIPGISWITHGRRITDVHGYGRLATWDVLVKSSNIGMVMLGERMGAPRLYRAVKGFGFGQPTGIDLNGEDPGLVYPLSRWKQPSIASVPQGYEMMVTPLQLARAFCAYANGGRLVQPHIVKGIVDAEGNVTSLHPEKPLSEMPLAIDPAAAATMRRILADVVVRGTARGARSQFWNLYGKTGTAHISEGKSGYSATKFNSTFIGAGPVEDPRLVVTFVVHEADRRIAHYGGTVSAPNAGRLLERALSYMQLPQSPDLSPPPPQVAAVLHNYNPKLYRKPTGATALAAD